MNNQFKNLIKNKKYIVTSMIVLLTIGILAFSLFRERADVLLEDDMQSNRSRVFSSYEEYNGNIIKLFIDEDTSIFYDSENNDIHSTKMNVDYFRILDEKSIVYLSSSLDLNTNEYVSHIVYVDLETKNEEVLLSGDKLFLEVSNGSVYIVGGKNGTVRYGDKEELKESSLNSPISKVVSSRGKIFAINHDVINNVVRSTIYCVTDNTIEPIIAPGKVQSVSVDYANDNIIYYSSINLNNSINSSDANNVVVYKQYLVDLAAAESKPEAIYTLNSNIISIKDKYISVDKDDESLYLLNNNFTKLKKLSNLHENGLSSMIKVSTDGENIYFIDKNGQLRKI